MQAGRLNHLITLQRRVAGKDAVGHAANGWEDVDTVWARAEPLRGREYFAAGTMQSEISVKFEIRWRAGVDGRMRVIWQGVAYAIVGEPINVNGARISLELMCAGGVREGGPA